MQYHINKRGVPAECKSAPEECKLGLTGEHWDSLEEAQKAADKLMSTQFALVPDVHYTNAVIPSEHVKIILSKNYSELYAVSKLAQKAGEPVLCLGKNRFGESVYHCVYVQDNLYYDINGLIATDSELLESYVKSKYNIASFWTQVSPEESINMIEKIMGIDLKSDGIKKRLTKYIQEELKNATENSSKQVALSFIMKEL